MNILEEKTYTKVDQGFIESKKHMGIFQVSSSSKLVGGSDYRCQHMLKLH
jgi:hypothetical protein